jgi:hypothetical protein
MSIKIAVISNILKMICLNDMILFCFDVLLTVNLSIILATDQINAQILLL